MGRKIELSEIEDLYLNKDYVFLKTDSGYKEDLQNSLKDHFKLTTMEAQKLKKHPFCVELIKNAGNIEIVDSRVTTTDAAITETEEEAVTLVTEAMI